MTDDSGLSVLDSFEGELLPDPLPAEPFTLFRAWFDGALDAKRQPNPNAMTLATVDADGRPSARIVLCKGIDEATGSVVFYTNYQSRKGRALDANPYATLVFHWDYADRQVRIEGRVEKATAHESDAYFQSRRWESRLGAWASEQSEPIASREDLLAQVTEKALDLELDMSAIVDGGGEGLEIPRPAHWGGYRVVAERVELWCGGTGRVHDRAEWRRASESGPWATTRLQP
ncbi:MAG: pyridoxamine 5'-phosphate oxidase [Planctomycetota bacterium]